MTKQKVTFPRSYNTLAHTFRNFWTLTKLLFGKTSILAGKLEELVDHIQQFELNYTKCFHQNWWFGAAILDRIHVRTQLYLRSYALGNPRRLNIATLEWAEILNSIAMNEFIANEPWWLETTADRKRSNPTSTSNTSKRGRNNRDNRDRGHEVKLRNWEPGSRLNRDESFQKIFHWKNREGMTRPQTSSGREICHHFFANGHCTDGCTRSHAPLTDTERTAWRSFIDHCRSNFAKFSNNHTRPIQPSTPSNSSDRAS